MLYGGARGGGKSDFLLGDFLQDVGKYGPSWRGLLIRRTYAELEDIISRSLEIYSKTGASFNKGEKTWTWPTGEILRMRYLERDADAMRYQGHAYPWIGVDEAGNFASRDGVFKLFACCRPFGDGAVEHLRIRLTGNPGGPGHTWLKQYFIDAAPGGFTPLFDQKANKFRMFIPSKVWDNKILLSKDPTYVDTLKLIGNDVLIKAWLEGDWNIVAGAYFDNDFSKISITPFKVPRDWYRYCSFDWGYATPFSVGWWAVSDGAPVIYQGQRRTFPRGSLIRYREWYGAKGGDTHNEGLKMDPTEIAQGILMRQQRKEVIGKYVADTQIFNEDRAKSIAKEFKEAGVKFDRADKNRLAGWMQMRIRMKSEGQDPLMYVFNTCADWFRTVPYLQHSERDPNDVQKQGEDHIGDESRYACMVRRIRVQERMKAVSAAPKGLETATMNSLWKLKQKTEAMRKKYGV